MRGLAAVEGLLGLLPTSLVYLVELPFGIDHTLFVLPENWRMGYYAPTDIEIALVLAMVTGAVSLPAFWYLVWLRTSFRDAESPVEGCLSFPLRDPGWNPKLFAGGLLLLLCPPVGWPLALGYRRGTSALPPLLGSRLRDPGIDRRR